MRAAHHLYVQWSQSGVVDVLSLTFELLPNWYPTNEKLVAPHLPNAYPPMRNQAGLFVWELFCGEDDNS